MRGLRHSRVDFRKKKLVIAGAINRQEKVFERHGVEISRKTMGGWLPTVAELLDPLYHAAKKVLFESKVIGTDDTGVKVLDPKLSFARTGRIWPYVGDARHPVVGYDYTATRGRDGPAKFLEGYTGYLQADAYSVYDAFFRPERGLTESGVFVCRCSTGLCWHARCLRLVRPGKKFSLRVRNRSGVV